MRVAEVILSVLMVVAIPFVAYRKKAFTLSAAVAAVVLLAIISFAGIKTLALIVASFLILSVVEKIIQYKKGETVAEEISKKTGARDLFQLGANGCAALLCILLFFLFGNHMYLCGYTAALAEALGDSMASSIGATSRGKTINLATLKETPPGLSGGVSIRGSVACVLSCAAIGLLSYVLELQDLYQMLIAIICGIIGCFLDSWLGASVQVKYQCLICGKITEKEMHCNEKTTIHSGIPYVDNDLVNVLSNMFSAALAIVLFLSLRTTTIRGVIENLLFFALFMIAASLLHEMGHLLGCAIWKCKVLAIKLWIINYDFNNRHFSINMRGKNNCVFSTQNKKKAKRVYLSGPCMNGILAIIGLVILFFQPSMIIGLFAIANVLKFICNIIPVNQTDGYMAFVALKED